MNSQNTPVHVRLWHHDFWRLAIANLLLTMSVYMLVPVLPLWLMGIQSMTPLQTGCTMGIFGLGLFVLGAFVSFLVQRFRRNVVCICAVLLQTGLLGAFYYLNAHRELPVGTYGLLLLRLALGACFGLAQMVLTSTLIIDTSESYQRTEANHAAGWFGRFALSLGPVAGILIQQWAGFQYVALAAMGCTVVSALLIMLVDFPFRTPEDDVTLVSLDRFFLPHGLPLFLNLLLIMVAVGMLFALPLPVLFYAMLMVGFLLALLAQRFVFCDAELKSEVVSGLILLIAAVLMMLFHPDVDIVHYAAPVFVGFSIGIIGSRFMLFFIKLSRHCQRGTSQSTFMLAWEGGIALGLALGIIASRAESWGTYPLESALVLLVLSLVAYHFTHDWFVRHKNR